jgi:transcriptional regulator with XRE-family HTH domain
VSFVAGIAKQLTLNSMPRLITPQQCKAARAALGWPRPKLAAQAGITTLTVRKFEIGEVEPHKRTVSSIAGALAAAGIEFIETDGDRPGIRWRTTMV